jgi:putative restriction endonuclease
MKFWVGTTDSRWFDFLSARAVDEVNFWQPSVKPPFTNAPEGMPFLFKLKRPHNHLAGGGFFIRHSAIPLSLAWEIFGKKNGADSLKDLVNLLGPLAKRQTNLDEIGCQIIANPFFLPPSQWYSDPPGWSSNLVRGKMYDSSLEDGGLIWAHFGQYFNETARVKTSDAGLPLPAYEPPADKFGEARIVKPRIGQGAFRLSLTEAYKRRCALTGESTLLALEAAHIVPYSGEGDHQISNGLLLRADFHKLFDAGLVGIAPDLKIKVSPRIREMWFNGKAYYRLHDQPMAVVPDALTHRPDPDRLDWHMRNVFQA